MKKKIIATMIAFSMPFALTACGTQKAEKTEPTNAATSSQQGETTHEKSSNEESSHDKVDTNPKIGDTVTYPDGLKITVTDQGEYAPGKDSAGVDNGTPHRLQFVVENGTEKNFDPTYLQITASSGGREASQIFDSENGLLNMPNTVVLPGKSVTWEQAFSFTDPDDVIIQIRSHDFGHEDIIYTR
ncbi:hypothetical protein [Arcanobacterium phocae]|uniref:hypothetical protein n=1 Tax=Arcanobacterium phocae TaxID=131112 RepID=UPI001C0EA6FB|nr:hypothetical protein [Arcanobacterium phocae]